MLDNWLNRTIDEPETTAFGGTNFAGELSRFPADSQLEARTARARRKRANPSNWDLIALQKSDCKGESNSMQIDLAVDSHTVKPPAVALKG